MFSFEVTKWKNVIQVDVDTEGNHTVGPSHPPAPSTRATFSLGGLPGELGKMCSRMKHPKDKGDVIPGARKRYLSLCQTNACFFLVFSAETDKARTGLLLPPLPHYVGCVRNLLINRRHVELPGAGTARGSVGLKGCPVL